MAVEMKGSNNPTITSYSDFFIQNVVGCGLFQVIVVISLFVLGPLNNAFVMMFMAFGDYNPGWRCLDSNATNSTTNHSLSIPDNNYYYQSSIFSEQKNASNNNNSFITDHDHCSLFDACSNIEYKPGTSTIVTEWGLICGRSWIHKILISLQMGGLFVGTLFVGYIGDAVGRKRVIYSGHFLICVFSIVAVFANSWEMFGAIRFLLGLSLSCVTSFAFVYTAEFVTVKWRAPISGSPIWSIVYVIFAVSCMLVKQWRHVEIIGAVIGAITCLPALWLPESLRWLEVKGKTDQFNKAVKKIAWTNRKEVPSFQNIDIQTTVESGKSVTDGDQKEEKVIYNTLHLFKSPYRKHTLLITLPCFSMSLIFYAIGLGVSALSGNFYINLIIVYASEFPFIITFGMNAPNVIGRKLSGIIFAGICGVCLITAACFQRFLTGDIQTTGVLVLAIIGRMTINAYWGVIMTVIVELYPTVIRGIASSYGQSFARLGGIICPFLIPTDKGSFFICYAIMGMLAIFCSALNTLLPETRGKKLVDKF